MEHTLEPDQYVLVDKLTPRFDNYKRGDIVVFTPPADWAQDDGTPFIKRVIGVGGDTVEIRDGGVYVNGMALDEPYIFADAPGDPPEPTIAVAGELDRPRGRALPDGRPSRQLGRFARRSGPVADRRTSSAGRGCATGRSNASASCRRPTHPELAASP